MTKSQIKTCFNGCSFTFGIGFSDLEREKYVYNFLLADQHNWNSTNIAQPGSSNHNIFLRSAEAIQQKLYDVVFTQWSGLNRIWLSPGPETYYFVNDEKNPDYTYRDIYINSKNKKTLNELLLMLNHDYQNIINLITYCTILEQLGQANSTKVIFINGLVPWQDDLIQPLTDDLSKSLSSYSKSILDFDNRSDTEIFKYFSILQKKFSVLNKNIWVNLFNSFQSCVVDIAPAGHHPGINSHQWMADQINSYLLKNPL
jgi:hypothetical protein